ncbi:MAG: CCA tRNA nucleotidyltransferase [Methanomicrobiales archaeon]|nr:CCA tRNA nucleotidyltransferase [Methanomicrobiales archaeon]
MLDRIRPTEEERALVLSVAERLVRAIRASGVARPMIVGSVARNTWVRGDLDLDIFLLFPASISRRELEEQGLSLARRLAQTYGERWQEKYAEHPYINTQIGGIDVDLVPCFEVECAREIQSAVDRTPFHTLYLMERIGEWVDDVLLCKQFMMAGGIYGSDQMTEGFSGYLCELLILHYRGFRGLIRAAAAWKKRTYIDIEGHGAKQFDEPLVVIDPIDPARNVAAAVSLTRKFEFVELARGYLERPLPSFFFHTPQPPMRKEDFMRVLSERGTALYAIVLSTPPYIPDVVVPQLRKSQDAVVGLLERHGFSVNRSDCSMNGGKSMLLFELLEDTLPPVKRHVGPPLWSAENAAKFARKYQQNTYAGPFIQDGIYIVEIPRRYQRAFDLLSSQELLEVGHGRHIKQVLKEGWTVRAGAECWEEEFAEFIGRFLCRISPLTRIRRREERQAPGA